MKNLFARTKNLSFWDIAFTKLAVMFFVMFLFAAYQPFRLFIQSINPTYLLLCWIIFALKPLFKFFR